MLKICLSYSMQTWFIFTWFDLNTFDQSYGCLWRILEYEKSDNCIWFESKLCRRFMVGWKLHTVGSFTIVTNYCAWSLTMKFLWEYIFPTFWSMSNSRNSIKNHKFSEARLIKLKNHMPLLPFKTSNTIKFHTIGWIVWFYECNSHTHAIATTQKIFDCSSFGARCDPCLYFRSIEVSNSFSTTTLLWIFRIEWISFHLNRETRYERNVMYFVGLRYLSAESLRRMYPFYERNANLSIGSFPYNPFSPHLFYSSFLLWQTFYDCIKQ